MRQLAVAMRAATADPPPTTVSLDDLITGELRRRRQSRVRLLAVAGAVTLVATTAPVMLGQARPAWSPAAGPSGPPVTASATASPPGRDDPADNGRHEFTSSAAAVVDRSLPDGYRMAGRPVEYWAAEFSLMWADLAGPDGRRTQLFAYRVEGGPGPTGDACEQAPLDGTRFAGREQACELLVLAGETLRVATSRDVVPGTEDRYEFTIVTRYGDGWTLHLWELPYPHPFSDREPRLVDTPVFTARQLAELALDPDLSP